MKTSHRYYLGIFLLSFATLLLEVSLTRVLSVALWYHFGFLVISTALLGFGASGSVLALWKRLQTDIPQDKAMFRICLAFSVSIIASFWLIQQIPFAPFSLFSAPWQMLYMPLYFFVLSLPFFCSGIGISLLLTRGAEDVNRLYAWDLAGAALGCLSVVAVLPWVGGAGAIFVAASTGALAALTFITGNKFLQTAFTIFIAATLLTGSFFASHLIPISITPNKGVRLRDRILEYTAWNVFSKVDLYSTLENPETGDPASKIFILDEGTAASGITDIRPGLAKFKVDRLVSDTLNMRDSGLAIVGKEKPHVLVIGSGAGADVYTALEYGAGKVTAIDINPLINRRVLEDPFFGGLFQIPEVELYTDEGRSFIRRSDELYDAIISTHTITNSAMASGALNLAENYILTKEAFADYFDHLSPDGTLFFTRPEYQLPRLFTTVREVLEEQGTSNPAQHLYAWRWPPRNTDERSFIAGLLIRKTPYTTIEIRELDDILSGMASLGGSPELLYSPFKTSSKTGISYAENTPLKIYTEILKAQNLPVLYSLKEVKLAPTTDDQPFFNHRTRWSSIDWDMISDIFQQERRGRMALEDRPISEVTLLALLLQVSVVATILILIPLLRLPKQASSNRNGFTMILYFAGLGLGFILLEIAYLQRFTLYLGQPTFTFASVLGGLLLFTGLGAFLGNNYKNEPIGTLKRIIPILIAVIAIISLVMPFIFQFTISWPIFLRVITSQLVLAPVGIMLGMPLPLGLRVVNMNAPDLVPWSWGVNGFFTVIGSILAVILGMTFGFKVVILTAIGCYTITWLVVWKLAKALNVT